MLCTAISEKIYTLSKATDLTGELFLLTYPEYLTLPFIPYFIKSFISLLIYFSFIQQPPLLNIKLVRFKQYCLYRNSNCYKLNIPVFFSIDGTVPSKNMCLAFIYKKLVILSVRCLSIPYLKYPVSLFVHVKWLV